MSGNEQALSVAAPASIQLQPTTTASTNDSTTDGVRLEIPSAEVQDPAAQPQTTAQAADPQQRTWWEWMVMNMNSLGESLNPSYEFGKRPPPPPPTVPQGAVSVPMPRTLSGAAAERHQTVSSRSKTALLLRAFEGHPPPEQPPAETPAAS